jgi:hypothetical protein
MKAIRMAGAAALAAACVVAVNASGPIAVYARVDKVAIDPSPETPGTIQIWGVFSAAKGQRLNEYLPAARGYLYYKLPSNPEYRKVALSEWNDLKGLAGSKDVVAFGSQFAGAPTVRKADERPQSPDEYSLNFGIRKMSEQTSAPPVRAILDFKP